MILKTEAEPSMQNTLYRSGFEHENCGIGAVVNIKGVPSHATVDNALTIVETLEHRAGKDAEGKTGDGVAQARGTGTLSPSVRRLVWAEEALEIAEERREAKGKGEKER